MSKIKYQIWNGIYNEVFDDKTFDTYEEAEKYFNDNLRRLQELADEYYGRPTNLKDIIFIDEVKVTYNL